MMRNSRRAAFLKAYQNAGQPTTIKARQRGMNGQTMGAWRLSLFSCPEECGAWHEFRVFAQRIQTHTRFKEGAIFEFCLEKGLFLHRVDTKGAQAGITSYSGTKKYQSMDLNQGCMISPERNWYDLKNPPLTDCDLRKGPTVLPLFSCAVGVVSDMNYMNITYC